MCDCITKMNQMLNREGPGYAIAALAHLRTGQEKVSVMTLRWGQATVYKIAPKIVPDFCPFCGERYQKSEESEAHAP